MPIRDPAARREAARRYRQGAAGKAASKRRNAARRNTPKQKAMRKAYASSPKGKLSRNKAARAKRDNRPFLGVDGEGWGRDDLGRQHYMMMRAGDAELFTGKPLSTLECLGFLCDMPAGCIPVGFSFGYDVTMILRDLPKERLAHLFRSRVPGKFSNWTFWQGFGIEYLPRNYLRVCRTHEVTRTDRQGRTFKAQAAIPGTARTVYEVIGFFQCSFLKAIQKFGVGQSQWSRIAAMKAARGDFDSANVADVSRYCAIECDLLAQLMTEFRTVCLAADLRPRTWNGAGKLAGALHEAHNTVTRTELDALLPPGVERMASAAYYGGRFEVTRIGDIGGPVYEYDINSAYPAAMLALPCLRHGRWEPVTRQQVSLLKPDDLWIAPMRFSHAGTKITRQNLCGLPVRQEDGRLFWPLEGNGTYWSTEIRAASKIGCKAVPTGEGFVYRKLCACQPMGWVEALYDARKALGKDKRGYPIKLAINSLYGRLAQRVGTPRWGNFVWAGLITANTRAMLMGAASHCPASIVMLATDAVVSLNPLPLDIGGMLGQWKAKEHDALFIVQPGIYFGGGNLKTQGVSGSFFAGKTDAFRDAWRAWSLQDRAAVPLDGPPPPATVQLPVTLFAGIKLSCARGEPETAGIWSETQRNFSFDWSRKRAAHTWQGNAVWTFPCAGSPTLQSMPHAGDRALLEAMDIEKLELEEQPDYISFGPVDWE